MHAFGHLGRKGDFRILGGSTNLERQLGFQISGTVLVTVTSGVL